jgi:hypothetical protein
MLIIVLKFLAIDMNTLITILKFLGIGVNILVIYFSEFYAIDAKSSLIQQVPFLILGGTGTTKHWKWYYTLYQNPSSETLVTVMFLYSEL